MASPKHGKNASRVTAHFTFANACNNTEGVLVPVEFFLSYIWVRHRPFNTTASHIEIAPQMFAFASAGRTNSYKVSLSFSYGRNRSTKAHSHALMFKQLFFSSLQSIAGMSKLEPVKVCNASRWHCPDCLNRVISIFYSLAMSTFPCTCRNPYQSTFVDVLCIDPFHISTLVYF